MIDPIVCADDFTKIDSIIEQILEIFKSQEIHATWAFVGLLGFQNKDELISFTQHFEINYSNKIFSPYPISSVIKNITSEKSYLSFQQIKAINSVPGQELASHTFSHFYVLEEGQKSEDFKLDCESMNEISKKFDVEFSSIIFPRNQVNKDYLNILVENKFNCYRGNQENKFWKNSAYYNERLISKAGRVIDAYFKITHTKLKTIQELELNDGLLNIAASRFLRPVKSNQFLEKRKISRIKNEMTNAAKNGQIYHLWWHPHNFIHNPEKSISQLNELIAHFHTLSKTYNFQSSNMKEISNIYHG